MPHCKIHMAMCGGRECLRELPSAQIRNSVCKLHVHHFIYTIRKFWGKQCCNQSPVAANKRVLMNSWSYLMYRYNKDYKGKQHWKCAHIERTCTSTQKAVYVSSWGSWSISRGRRVMAGRFIVYLLFIFKYCSPIHGYCRSGVHKYKRKEIKQ